MTDNHKTSQFQMRFSQEDQENIAMIASEHSSLTVTEIIRYALREASKPIHVRKARIASINRVTKRI